MGTPQILVVEDESIIARNIQLELKGLGYGVSAIAGCGEEALQKAAETYPDLVLMDIVLKGDMDGVETARRLRQRLDVPVVFLSAYADDDTLRRVTETGPFGYLVKPYEERELATTIEIALHKHRTERALREVRELLTCTLRCIGDAVLVTDARACVRLLNRAAERLTGWSEKEALGRELLDVFELRNEASPAHPATRALQTAQTVSLPRRSRLVGKDERETPVEGKVSPLYLDGDYFIGFVAVFREVAGPSEAEVLLGANGLFG